MTTSRKFAAIFLCFGLFGSSSAFARGTPQSYLGIGGGVTSPGFSGAEAGPAVGLKMGRRLTPDFGVGAYFQGSGHSSSPGESSTKHLLYGLEGNYHFTGDMDGLAIGLSVGLATLSPSQGRSSSALTFGPKLSFDQWIGESTSLGFEGSYLSRGEKDGVDGYSTVNLLLIAKLWF